MAKIIEVPGMGQVEFPDNMPDDQISAAIKRNMEAYAPTPTPIAERFMRGLRDPIDAGAQLLTRALPKNLLDSVNAATGLMNRIPVMGDMAKAMGMTPATPQQIDEGINQREANYIKPQGIDWARMGGNIATTLPASLAGPVPQTLKGAAGIGGTMGGLFGLLQPVTEKQDDFWKEKTKQSLASAAAGTLAGPVSYGIAKAISPNVSDSVKTLIDEGVTPTPGQILGGTAKRVEDKLTSVPILGDAIKSSQRKSIDELNRAVYGRAVNPIGGNVPQTVGREAVQDVSDQLSKAYNNLLPKLSFKADAPFAQELSTISNMASQLPEQQANQFQKIIQTQVVGKMTQQGNASGETIKQIESELGRLASGYKGDASFDNRQLGAALSEVQSSIRKTLERANPQFADELSKINQGYAAYARLRDAAGRQGATEGLFTPAQLSSAVRAGDKSVGHGNFARGSAYMQDLSDAAKSVLSSTYPDSGTAGRMLLGAGAIGTGFLRPEIPLALGGASLPYLPGGRQLIAGLLARRPEFAEPVSNVIRRIPTGLLGASMYEAAQ